ncbi:MAG: hydrolase [Cyanobacteria bacterium REEB67]|nr:hydrolase [Cyanobacteria bacterium REEB67]
MDAPKSSFRRRHKNILEVGNALLVVVDVQERFRGHIEGYEELIVRTAILLRGLEALGVPVVITEQYPQGLGPTVAEIKNIEGTETARLYFEKGHFSAAASADFIDYLQKSGRKQIIVCGIETHVCVSQTVHDLLERGYQTHLVVDAVASRNAVDKEVGLKKMFASGSLPATVEMVLFELLVRSGTADFKQVQSLVK